MKVELNFEKRVCRVTKEKGDPIFKNGGYAGDYAAEHRFFYWIKKALQEQGLDVIKKSMGQDGNLMDDRMPLVRTRSLKPYDKHGNRKYFCIYDGNYALRNSALEFNKEGHVTLNIDMA